MRNILVLMLLLCTIAPLAAAESAAPPGPVLAPPPVWQRKVDIDVKDTPLKQTLDVLFRDTDISYSVDPGVADLKITAVLKGIPIDAALQEILKGAGATMERSNNVYHIMARQPLGGYPRLSLDDVARKGPSQTKIFAIIYINPAELVPLIYTLGARQVSVVSGGKLVVNATAEVIAEAADLILQLDTEEALPRPVRVEVVAYYDLTDDAGKKESFEVGAQGSVPEGTPIALHAVGAAKSEPFNQGLLLDVGFVPEIGAGSQISLNGNVSISARAEDSIPVTLSSSPVALSMTSGKPQVISSGALGIEGGKLRFEVLATVTIGEGRLRTKTGFGGGGGFSVPGVGNFGGYGAPRWNPPPPNGAVPGAPPPPENPNPANHPPPLVHGVPEK